MVEQNEGPSGDAIFTDAPVTSRAKDTLGRARFAELVAAQVSASPGGMVFGLTGP